MAAQLKGTVYVTDPDTRQTVELAPGTSPDPRYAALVTNPAAWVDGKLPRLPKAKAEDGSGDPSASGQDGASGDASAASEAADPTFNEEAPAGGNSENTKPAARKTAARKPARGRTTADEGTGGQ